MYCGSVWLIYSSSSRARFLSKLEELLGDRYIHVCRFEVLNSVEETSCVLGSELWEQNFNNVWEVRKQ